MPILPTAIMPNGDVDETSQRRLVQYSLQCGAVAIGHFGFASEFHKISDDDRRLLTKIIVDETAGRVPTFMGVTAQGHNVTVRYAVEAEQLGADILMVALPLINLPTQQEAFDLFQAISDTVSLPIIVQDIPESANVLSPELVCRMAREIENVRYVKAEGTNFIPKTEEVMKLADGELEVIGGSGGKHMIHLLRLGVTSFMTGTEALDLHGAAVKAYLDGNEDEAADIYFQRIAPYFAFYDAYSEELLKVMLHERGIIDHPDVIAPRAKLPMSEIEWREFNWVLDRIGWRKQWPEIP
ncbi:MAG: dihydrodipicolinate synthase family protein [Fuerstiella sp.]|nr:dihydrodipicolinate synthase family protein [Fuerstiella sp.]